MPGRTRSYTLQLPTFIRSQRNLAPESKKRHRDTKSNYATPMQTVCESGLLNLYPIADDDSPAYSIILLLTKSLTAHKARKCVSQCPSFEAFRLVSAHGKSS